MTNNEKNPIEEFNSFSNRHGMTPIVKTYSLGESKKYNIYDTSEDEDGEDMKKEDLEDERPDDMPYVNYKSVIFYKGNQILCTSYGNTKEHSKRNACMLGLAKLREEMDKEPDNQDLGVSVEPCSQNNNEDSHMQDESNIIEDSYVPSSIHSHEI